MPDIVQGLEDIQVQRKTPLVLMCAIQGMPDPELQWLKGNTPVLTGTSSSVDANGTVYSKLTIPEARVSENNAEYTCLAKYIGVPMSASSTGLVTVIGKHSAIQCVVPPVDWFLTVALTVQAVQHAVLPVD